MRVLAGEERVQNDFGELLRRADRADAAAAHELFALLYEELRELAERHLRRGGPELTISASTLVHEVYLSIVGRREIVFPDRARFFAYASRAMRGLVIDYARRGRAKKRGRDIEITLVEDRIPAADPNDGLDLESLGDALERLGRLDPNLAELVDLHFFAGFTFVEVAELRGVSERTVQRDWRKARLLLHQAMAD
jgi:RNA polymerase sigma factor (TIGR02999 family)